MHVQVSKERRKKYEEAQGHRHGHFHTVRRAAQCSSKKKKHYKCKFCAIGFCLENVSMNHHVSNPSDSLSPAFNAVEARLTTRHLIYLHLAQVHL